MAVSSFFSAAKRPMVDITSFLKENSGGSLKYSAVANEVHKIYFPYQEIQTDNGIVKAPVAQQANVHDMHVTPDKFESCVCLSGVTRTGDNGEVINDGSCPFCDRYSDSWAIKNYREQLALEGCTKTGKDLEDYKKALSSQYGSEIKVSKAKPKAYVLVAKFNCDAQGNPQLENGLPTYELKIMALTARRLEDFQSMFITSGLSLAGGELSIKYPNLKDARQIVGQSVPMPAFGAASVTTSYPAVVEKIQAEVADFKWEGIETSFPEWKGMSTEQARIKCTSMFSAWDAYTKELSTNPNARYLEYGGANTTNPALTMNTGNTGNTNQGVQMPNGMNPSMGMQGFTGMNAPEQPTMGMGDMGAMFGAMGNGPTL